MPPFFTIAIVGKPNVGKSTLFNRLTGSKEAIVYDQPGVTRDRRYGIIEWDRNSFQVIDTGGYEVEPQSDIFTQMRKQVEIAISEADLILWVVDGKTEISSDDREMGSKLRRIGKPIFLVVNKVDHSKQELLAGSFYELGIEKVFPVSAEHGRGVSDLLDEVVRGISEERIPSFVRRGSRGGRELEESTPPDSSPYKGEECVRVSILGRPNVGKSTLLNRLFGAPRAVVHDVPGTTRDPLNIKIHEEGIDFEFVDTAGIRKKSHSEGKIEKVSVLKALRSLEKSDVAILMVDAQEGLTSQDRKIAERILQQYKPFLILVNKSDLLSSSLSSKEIREKALDHFEPLSFIPMFPISAKTGRGLSRLFREIKKIREESKKRLTTGELNRLFRTLVEAHPPPLISGKSINLFYMTQVGEAPPRFVVFTNRPTLIPETYKRYLIRSLRNHFSFRGVPIQLQFKTRKKKRFHQ